MSSFDNDLFDVFSSSEGRRSEEHTADAADDGTSASEPQSKRPRLSEVMDAEVGR